MASLWGFIRARDPKGSLRWNATKVQHEAVPRDPKWPHDQFVVVSIQESCAFVILCMVLCLCEGRPKDKEPADLPGPDLLAECASVDLLEDHRCFTACFFVQNCP